MADQNDAEFMPINTRSPAQWAVLQGHYDFAGKYVLDVGCGYGDLGFFAKQASAHVFGVEHDKNITPKIVCVYEDLVLFLETDTNYFDVVFCFSVLPYVDMDRTLAGLARIANVAFIECQLKDDGPGTLTEQELEATLGEFWTSVEKIGFTEVLIRDTERPIWMCSHDS